MPDKHRHTDYRVGWICPLEVESLAAMVMLDERHERLSQPDGDPNSYILGAINGQKVVIASLPTPGNCPAATVVVQMRRTFTNLRHILLVGIGGGVPVETDNGPIRLGHVVVSQPTGAHSGVVQYDHGKAKDGTFERTGALPPPATALLNAVRQVCMEQQMAEDDPIWASTQMAKTTLRRGYRRFAFPGRDRDHLYRADYPHAQPGVSCEEAGCDPAKRIPPGEEVEDAFVPVHRGTIASGELVIKDAQKRDELARAYNVLCFEMEAAGALADVPCLVVRGVSDYCDSHKNDAWHGFAALAAAAFARQLFFHLPLEESAAPVAAAAAAETQQQQQQPPRVYSPQTINYHGSGDVINSGGGTQNITKNKTYHAGAQDVTKNQDLGGLGRGAGRADIGYFNGSRFLYPREE